MLLRSIWNWLTGTTPGYSHGGTHYGPLRNFRAAYLWWLYPVIAVYTFGYDATNYPSRDYDYGQNGNVEACRVESDFTVIKATAAGAFWPLFWTWEVMDDSVEKPQC